MKNKFIRAEIIADHAVTIWESKEFNSFGYYAFNIDGNCMINWGGFSSIDALLANARIEIPLEIAYLARRELDKERESLVNSIKEFEKQDRLVPQD